MHSDPCLSAFRVGKILDVKMLKVDLKQFLR